MVPLTEMLSGMLPLIEFHLAWATVSFGEENRGLNPVVWEVACLGGHTRIGIRCTLFWNEKWGQQSAGKGCVEKETKQMPQCKSRASDNR